MAIDWGASVDSICDSVVPVTGAVAVISCSFDGRLISKLLGFDLFGGDMSNDFLADRSFCRSKLMFPLLVFWIGSFGVCIFC